MPNTQCVCGHQREAHEHYRRGTDCATCGPELCPKFRRALVQRQQPEPPKRPSAEQATRDGAARRTRS